MREQKCTSAKQHLVNSLRKNTTGTKKYYQDMTKPKNFNRQKRDVFLRVTMEYFEMTNYEFR